MIIDAHQHLWDPRRAEYSWLPAEHPSLQRTIGTEEVLPDLRRNRVAATVLVQAADNREDTRLMLDAAVERPDVIGVVAHVPLDHPHQVEEQLAELLENPLVVGIRTLIHTMPDPDWILRSTVQTSLALVAAAGLTFDVVSVLPRHLEHVPTLSDLHPGLKIVIDHLSKPPIGADDRHPWWDLIARAAENPLVHAKISGLYTATADPTAPPTEQLEPFVDRALDCFGADRLMFGSDWPICLPLGGYDRICDTLMPMFDTWTLQDRADVLGGTATRFYQLTPRS